MKILFVHTLYGQNGGEDQVCENEIELLREVADVKQLYFNNAGSKLNILSKFMFAPFNLLSLIKFNKTISIERPDIIHFHNWYFAASPLLLIWAKAKKIPVVVTLHNYRLLCPSATLFHKGGLFIESLKKGFPWKAVSRKVYRDSYIQTFWLSCTVRMHKWLRTWQKVDKYIALTPFAKQLFLSSDLGLRWDQLDVKSNFTPDNGYNFEKKEDYFLFVGRLSPEKGIDILLKTFSDTDLNLVIIGDGPLCADVEKAASMNQNISYLGKKPHSDIINYMKQASALIFPSIWYEGMPMTILESFSTGTPVIASRLGAMESLIRDEENGLLFSAADCNSLKSALDKWKNLPDKEKSSMCLNARQAYDDNYTPEHNRVQVLSIYNSLMNDKASIYKPMEAVKSTPKTDVLRFPVFNSQLEDMKLKERAVINTINQYSYVMATKDSQFKEALLASDVLLPDGIGIIAACRLLNGMKLTKIAGSDLHTFLLKKLNATGGRCFYLGSSLNTLEKIKENCKLEYDQVEVGYYAPPFKPEFDDYDNQCMIDAINSFNPDVLFIGLSAPKQEKWVHLNKNKLNVKTICSIGAVFDFYAGTVNRPSKFWVNMGLEWFVRLMHEPNRLWKRYLYYGPVFMFMLLKEKVLQSVGNQKMFTIQTKIIKVSYISIKFKNAKAH